MSSILHLLFEIANLNCFFFIFNFKLKNKDYQLAGIIFLSKNIITKKNFTKFQSKMLLAFIF